MLTTNVLSSMKFSDSQHFQLKPFYLHIYLHFEIITLIFVIQSKIAVCFVLDTRLFASSNINVQPLTVIESLATDKS